MIYEFNYETFPIVRVKLSNISKETDLTNFYY